MALNDNVKSFREDRNLSQLQLAEQLGVNQAMISYIESGMKVPSLALTISLANAFGCTIDELVGRQSAHEIA
jgi:transcriptional regulator with XRE-family HTH domain